MIVYTIPEIDAGQERSMAKKIAVEEGLAYARIDKENIAFDNEAGERPMTLFAELGIPVQKVVIHPGALEIKLIIRRELEARSFLVEDIPEVFVGEGFTRIAMLMYDEGRLVMENIIIPNNERVDISVEVKARLQ